MQSAYLYTAIAAVGVVIVYMLPFILAPWIRVLSALWGFVVGRRAANAIKAQYPKDGQESPSRTNVSEVAKERLEEEVASIRATGEERVRVLRQHADALKDKAERVVQESKHRSQRAINQPHGQAYSIMKRELSKVNGKNLLMLVGVVVVLFIDALIARQVFRSLGLYLDEKLEIFGYVLPVDFNLIYGAFITIGVAFFLHVVWSRERLKSAFAGAKGKMGLISGLVILGVFFVIRLAVVAAPDRAEIGMELLLMVAWMLGVVAVFWMVSEVLGDEERWANIAVVVGLPLVLVVLVIAGGILLLQVIADRVISAGLRGWLGVCQVRVEKRLRNVEEGHQRVAHGFYRGLKF